MKGQSQTNSFLAIAAALALLAGVTALSLTDPVHDVAAPGDFIDSDGDGIQVDEPALNRTVESGGLEDTAEYASEGGLVNDMAEDLAQFISGEEIDSGDPEINDTLPEMGENESLDNVTPPDEEPELDNITEPGEDDSGILEDFLNTTSELINFEEESEEEESDEQDSETEREGLLPDIPDGVLAALLLLMTGLAAAALYRSDVDTKKLLKQIIRKARELVKAAPDIFRRLIVNTATLLSNTVQKLLKTLVDLARRPVSTASEIKEGLTVKIINIHKWLLSLRDGGWKRKIRENLPVKEEPENSLEYVWRLLKRKAGVENDNTYTPLEVGGLALEHDLDRETVGDIVEAYRLEQYSSEGYTGELDISEWRKNLGDESE